MVVAKLALLGSALAGVAADAVAKPAPRRVVVDRKRRQWV